MLGPVALSGALAQPLTEQEERGKQIYFEGTSARGNEIEAFIGEDLTPLPGFAAACSSCHGADGRGRPEAGVIPSDVTWDYLMKSYGHSHPMGRRHGPFTEESIRDSIVKGHDASGNELDPSMPVYLMSDADLDDLIAYMKRLESDLDPGLSGEAIRIGTVLPTTGRMATVGQGIREVLTAYFERLNAGGGIHHRELRLVEASWESASESPLEATSRLLREGDVFALLSPVVAGSDRAIGELVEEERVPLVGPFSLFTPDPYAINDYTFYLFSGLGEQAAALVDFAAEELLGKEGGRMAVVAPQEAPYGEIARAVAERAAGLELELGEVLDPPVSADQAAALAARGAGEGTEVLFVLGPVPLRMLLEAAGDTGWHPWVLLPGAFVSRDVFELPAGFHRRLHLSYPTVPGDQTAAGMASLEEMLAAQGHSMRHRTSQVSALVAAKILLEGLKAAGRDLSRQKLVEALEKLVDFSTGLSPPVTYGPNRRVGALGAYVVTVDLEKREFVPVGGWTATE